MTEADAKKEINAMGPKIREALRRGGPREMMRVSAQLAPRLRELRPYLRGADQRNIDRILNAVDLGGF